MRLLILGGDGMLGHQLARSLSEHHEVHVTLRGSPTPLSLHSAKQHWNIDALDWPLLARTIGAIAPDAVLNAVGVIKQRSDHKDAILNIALNSLLPHRLAQHCQETDIRLIHFSTDCVFTGERGNYTEDDRPDARDLYGLTKLLGEVGGPNAFTLRTSIVGLELSRNLGLIEWFLSQSEEIRGFNRAIFSGFTTLEMTRIVSTVLNASRALGGVYHVSSEPISKYELLSALAATIPKPIRVVRDESFHCDRSLCSKQFREAFRYEPPTWGKMIEELAAQIRERHA